MTTSDICCGIAGEETILWAIPMFSSRSVHQGVCVISVGRLTGAVLGFDARVDGSEVKVWASQLTRVHSKVAPSTASYLYHV